MLLSSGAYAAKIVGVNAGTPHEDTTLPKQYGFGGWDLGNVNVKVTNLDYNETTGTFYSDGTYEPMTIGDSFESEILSTDDKTTVMGRLHGKDWPVGEPAGIKVVNDDNGTAKSGKSPNCIMTTSYLDEVDSGTGESGYLNIYDTNPDGKAVPTVCSSPFQSHKRFKINMQPASVAIVDETTRYGQPIDLVFNLDDTDTETTKRYQVFSKLNNYTGKRLDGYKIELLDENGAVNPNADIRFSLDISPKESDESGYQAVFAHGLWGAPDKHFDENGFFDSARSGFYQEGNGTQELIGGPDKLAGNYADIFGVWLHSALAPTGIFFDDDNDPLTDAELVAFWGDPENTGTNAWRKGQADNWAEVTPEELLVWTINPLYSQGVIEDTLNLGPNYVVEVGDKSTIGETFTIRITPRVAPDADQVDPSYVADPAPEGYNSTSEGTIVMSFQEDLTSTTANVKSVTIADYSAKITSSTSATLNSLGDILVAVADSDRNNPAIVDTFTIDVKSDHGETEEVVLTETGANTGVFAGTLQAIRSDDVITNDDGKFLLNKNTKLNATYVDSTYGAQVDPETLEAVLSIAVAETPTDATDSTDTTSSGGGCTYNPNSKNFDMTFLLMMALGLLYPFRRRFLK
jgi:hypothetical protein